MVWKDTIHSEGYSNYISKRAVKKEVVQFYNSHTRKAKELNVQSDCKRTTEKPLTKDQSEIYNQMLERERIKNNPKFYKIKSK